MLLWTIDAETYPPLTLPLHSAVAKKMKLLLVILPFLPLLEAFAPCASRAGGVASFGGRPRAVGADRQLQLQMINQKRRVSCSINLVWHLAIPLQH